MAQDSRSTDSDTVYSFDPAIAGRRVEADGGAAAIGTRFPSREMFEGTLTGQRMDQGDPPWRWCEIGNLVAKPEEFDGDTVWCEESYIYELDDRDRSFGSG